MTALLWLREETLSGHLRSVGVCAAALYLLAQTIAGGSLSMLASVHRAEYHGSRMPTPKDNRLLAALPDRDL